MLPIAGLVGRGLTCRSGPTCRQRPLSGLLEAAGSTGRPSGWQQASQWSLARRQPTGPFAASCLWWRMSLPHWTCRKSRMAGSLLCTADDSGPVWVLQLTLWMLVGRGRAAPYHTLDIGTSCWVLFWCRTLLHACAYCSVIMTGLKPCSALGISYSWYSNPACPLCHHAVQQAHACAAGHLVHKAHQLVLVRIVDKVARNTYPSTAETLVGAVTVQAWV